MKDFSSPMKQNIPVVSVFNLKEVHNQRVCCQTFHENILSLCQIICKTDLKEIFQGSVFHALYRLHLFLQVVDRDGFFDDLN